MEKWGKGIPVKGNSTCKGPREWNSRLLSDIWPFGLNHNRYKTKTKTVRPTCIAAILTKNQPPACTSRPVLHLPGRAVPVMPGRMAVLVPAAGHYRPFCGCSECVVGPSLECVQLAVCVSVGHLDSSETKRNPFKELNWFQVPRDAFISVLAAVGQPLSATFGDSKALPTAGAGWPPDASWGLSSRGSKFKSVTCL